MRDLMKRLERLEQSVAPDTLDTMFVHFVGGPYRDPVTISHHGEALTRAPGESMDAFKARAEAHFEPRRLPGCGLVLFVDGDEAHA
jgi:hypothetical protein